MDVYCKTAENYYLLRKVEQIAQEFGYDRVAIQGEIAGPGIQGNPMGLTRHEFFLFDIYVTRGAAGFYLPYLTMLHLAEFYEIPTVPILSQGMTLRGYDFQSIYNLQYPNGHPAEGVVFVGLGTKLLGKFGRLKFKYVNPLFLLKKDK
jgi:ATP-dependent RNA circularization protein (DNA/RNA ligase family)